MTHRPGGGRLRGDRASATTETVLVMPALIGFLFLLVLAGRLTDARSDLVGAANGAARAASRSTTWPRPRSRPSGPPTTGAGEHLNCAGGPQVTVFPEGGFQRGGTVRVR